MQIFDPKTDILSAVPDGEAQDRLSNDSLYKKQSALEGLIYDIKQKQTMAEDARRPQEQIWLEDWKQFNGELSDDEKRAVEAARQRNATASALTVPITKTKTMASYGQLCEILFGDDTFPVHVEPTPVPEGIAEEVSIVPEEMEDPYGYEGDGRVIEPGTTQATLLGGLKDRVSQFIGAGKKLVEGNVPGAPTISPAEETAAKLNKVIQDQLVEQKTEREIRAMILEMCAMGTGVVKRPMTHRQTIHKWENSEEGLVHSPIIKIVPKAEFVTLWNVYPDPHVRRMEEASYVIERHKLSRHKLRRLKDQPFFFKDAIDRLLQGKGNYVDKWWEATSLLDNQNESLGPNEEWEVLEFTGYLTQEQLENIDGISKEEIEKFSDLVPVNVWISGDEVLKVILNPFDVYDAPWYYAVPYEEHPNQMWGKGLPRNMRNSQMIINGSMRMAVDNLKFAGSVMFEVNENNLSAGQNMDIYNGKIFYTNGGAPGQSVYSITTPNVAPSNMQLADKARQYADEETGQPSYSYGQYTTGQTRTASGMSMLMNAATTHLKSIVKNLDQYLLEPLGEALFHWNMQFNEEITEIRGDVRIRAKGTQAYQQKEIQSQRLLSFMQVGTNPALAPLINWEKIIKEFAKSTGLEVDDVINDPTKAMLYAELMGKVNNAINQGTGQANGNPMPGGGQGGSQPSTGGVNPQDQSGSGGGNIGVGNPESFGPNQSGSPAQ